MRVYKQVGNAGYDGGAKSTYTASAVNETDEEMRSAVSPMTSLVKLKVCHLESLYLLQKHDEKIWINYCY
jgi:hypothetical protein